MQQLHFFFNFFSPWTYEYLDEHWDEECDLLKRWCSVLGLKEGDYSIEKPTDLEKPAWLSDEELDEE